MPHKKKFDPISSDYESPRKHRSTKGRLKNIDIDLAENGFSVRYTMEDNDGNQKKSEVYVYEDVDEMFADLRADMRKHSMHKMLES